MNTTLSVIDRIKSELNIPSDYALAKLLGVTKQSMSFYRTKGSQFNDSTAAKAAKLLEIDPAELIANLHKERASNQDEFDAWETIEKRCNLANDLKKQEVAEALKAAVEAVSSPAQRKILKRISEQCILCKIGNFGESDTFGPLS